MDSNQCRLAPVGLQPTPFNHSGTDPCLSIVAQITPSGHIKASNRSVVNGQRQYFKASRILPRLPATLSSKIHRKNYAKIPQSRLGNPRRRLFSKKTTKFPDEQPHVWCSVACGLGESIEKASRTIPPIGCNAAADSVMMCSISSEVKGIGR